MVTVLLTTRWFAQVWSSFALSNVSYLWRLLKQLGLGTLGNGLGLGLGLVLVLGLGVSVMGYG